VNGQLQLPQRSRRRAGIAAAVLLAAGAAVAAQEFQMWRGGRGGPPRFPNEHSFDGGFTFCRLMYTSERYEDGGSGWRTDYPGADLNLPVRLGELTKTHIVRQRSGDAEHVVVRATDPALFRCPFVIASDVGTVAFSPEEAEGLRAYLEKGGFLWVDDFWGELAWTWWLDQIGRVLPREQYPVERLGPDHPIYRALFELRELPQVPHIGFWRRSGGGTSERGDESAEPDLHAIADRRGRVLVLMTHDTDISDSWEREGESPQFFFQFSPNGYAFAINAVIYAMSH
jgi:hypothetical protein